MAAAAAGAAEPIADPIKDQQHHPLSQPQAQLPGVSGIVPSQVVTGVVAPQASPDTINTDIVVCTTSDSVSTSVSDAIHRNQAVTKVTDVSVNGTIQNQQDKSEAVVLSDGSASDVHRVISSKSSGIHSNVGDVSDDRASGLIKKSELSKSEKPATSIPSSIVNSTRGHCVLSSSCSSETVDVESPTTLPQLQQPPIIVSLPPHSRTRCGSENVKQGPPQSTPPFPVQKAAPPDTTVLQPRSDKEVCIKFGTIDDILPQSVMSDKQQVLSPPLAIKLPTGPASGVTELPLTAMRPSGAPPGMPTHPIAHSAANKQLTSQVVQPKVVVPHPKQPSPTLPAADPVPPPPPPLLQVHPKQNGEMVEPDNDNVDIADSADVAGKIT